MSSLPTDTTDKTAIDADYGGSPDWGMTGEQASAAADAWDYPVIDYDLTKEDLISVAVTQAFGDRCDDFDDHCPCCLAWKQYDEARSSAARAKHFEDHFQRVAKEHGPANAALDTARREWAAKTREG